VTSYYLFACVVGGKKEKIKRGVVFQQSPFRERERIKEGKQNIPKKGRMRRVSTMFPTNCVQKKKRKRKEEIPESASHRSIVGRGKRRKGDLTTTKKVRLG